jgi:hypothetical protein
MGSPEKITQQERQDVATVPVTEIYELCRKKDGQDGIDYQAWIANPDAAIAQIKTLNIKDSKKSALDAFLDSANRPAEKLPALVKILRERESRLSHVREKKETLRKDVIVEKASDFFESVGKTFENLPTAGKVAIAIAGVFVLKELFSFFSKTKTGKAVGLTAATLGIWAFLGKSAEAGTNGKNSLGVNTVLDKISGVGGGVDSFGEVYEKTGLNNEWAEEMAAVSDTPLSVLLSLYKAERKNTGNKKIINLKDSRLALKNKARRQLTGEDLYAMLDYIFGGTFESDSGQTFQHGDLLNLYGESNLSFGNFMMELASKEEIPFLDEVSNAASNILSGTIKGVAKIAAGVIVYSIKIGGGTLKEVTYDPATELWQLSGIEETKTFNTVAEAFKTAKSYWTKKLS